MNSVPDQEPAHLVSATGMSEDDHDVVSEALRPSENSPVGDESTKTHERPEESAVPISRMEEADSGAVAISFQNPRSFLNYAMADSGIGLFESVTVKNEGELKSKVYVRVEATINDDVVVGGAESKRFDLDMDSRQQFTSRELSFLLKPDLLSQVEWSAHGRLTAAVVFNGKIIAQESLQITVLEARQWVQCESVVDLPPDYDGPPPPVDMSSMALLAAFTQYQSPAIKDLVEAAQPFLNQIDAFVGYQADEPTIVDAQVRAIAEAMRRRGIAYHNPEPGWIYTKGAGQTIRTPEDVLVGREGTCLDTSVVLAAALERVDIRPLIFVIQGHAFLAYWRQEDRLLPQSYFTDKGVVQHLVQSGLLGFVETTKLTQGNESLSLDEIQAEPLESRLKANLSNFQGIIDVFAARRLDGISPLPVRAEINGEIRIIVAGENQTGQAREHIIRVEREEDAAGVRQETPARVQFWKNALLDLSLRNALINFKDTRGASLHIPGQDLGKFEDILNAEQVLELLPNDALSETAKKQGVSDAKDLPDHAQSEILFSHSKIFSNLDAARYETALTRMQHRARTYRQETGANNLYVAVGILEWPFSPTNSRFGSAGVKTLRSPLILVPVKLERPGKSSTFRLSLDPTGESTPNFSLLEKLRRELDIDLPDIWTPATDQSGIDVEKTFKDLQAALYAKNLSNFHVEPTAHLGIFQFSKFRLWKDLNDHWEEFVQNPVVGHLALKSHEVFEDPVEIPAETDYDSLLKDCPLPADGSQLRAIDHAVHGRSFVLEGPPGTGKSQTIANMLARAIVNGKKVLFVAEKSQALSVVKKRLDAVGFGDLTLDIHDKSSSPAEIKAQINRSLDAQAKDVDEQVAQILRTLDVSESLLYKYVDKLRAPNAAGFTLYEAVLTSLEPREGVAPLRVPEEFVANTSQEDIEKLRAVMRSLVDLEGGIKLGPESGWRFLADRLEMPQREALLQACEAIDQIVNLVSEEPALARVLEGPRSPAQLEMAVTVLAHDNVTKEILTAALGAIWDKSNAETINELQSLASRREGALALFEPSVLDGDIARVAELVVQLSHQGFFQKRRTLKEAMELLAPYAKEGIKLKARNIQEYSTLLSSLAGAVQEAVKSLTSRIGYEITAGLNPLTEDGRSALKDALTHFRGIARFYAEPEVGNESELHTLLEVREQLRGDNIETLRALLDAFTAMQRQFDLKNQDFESWSHDTGLVSRWSQTAALRQGAAGANGLASWMQLLEALSAFDEHDFGDAKQQVLNKDIRLSDLPLALENGIAAASVDERLNSLGLSEFDGPNHNVQVARFSRNLGQLRSLLTDSLPSSVLNNRPFDTSGTRGRIAQLRNQVTKKRGGLTIRALFAEFSDIIPNLLPCVMTNPDGIARLFPPRAHQFDLVIFDEAQCLPSEFLRPVVFAIRELQQHYGVIPVLCTATQPVLTQTDSFDFRFREGFPSVTEIIKDPHSLSVRLKRVKVDVLHGLDPVPYDAVADHILRGKQSVLCVLNRKDDCRYLADRLPTAQTFCLTTNLCAEHRSKVLARIRERLKDDSLSLYVISTSLVEAGVDLDFPVVYRALCGLDSIAQAAGRCNREGLLDAGKTIVFMPQDQPDYVQSPASISREYLKPDRLPDVFLPQTFQSYFGQRFFQLGTDALDKEKILSLLGGTLDFSFRTVAERFRMIDDDWQRPIIVPYGEAQETVDKLLDEKWNARRHVRMLQRFSVSIPVREHQMLLDADHAHMLKDWPGICVLHNKNLYSDRYGYLSPGKIDSYAPEELIG